MRNKKIYFLHRRKINYITKTTSQLVNNIIHWTNFQSNVQRKSAFNKITPFYRGSRREKNDTLIKRRYLWRPHDVPETSRAQEKLPPSNCYLDSHNVES